MLWEGVLALAVLAAWVYALRWAIRTDRAARSSARVLEEAEKVLRDAADGRDQDLRGASGPMG